MYRPLIYIGFAKINVYHFILNEFCRQPFYVRILLYYYTLKVSKIMYNQYNTNSADSSYILTFH